MRGTPESANVYGMPKTACGLLIVAAKKAARANDHPTCIALIQVAHDLDMGQRFREAIPCASSVAAGCGLTTRHERVLIRNENHCVHATIRAALARGLTERAARERALTRCLGLRHVKHSNKKRKGHGRKTR